MNLLFSMSLAGSLFFLVYLLIRPVVLLRFPSAWRYRFLKITLLFFLLPFQRERTGIGGLLEVLFGYENHILGKDKCLEIDTSRLHITFPDGRTYMKNQELLQFAYATWGTVILVITLYYFIKYIRCKMFLQKISTPPSSIKLYTDHKKAKKRRKKVKLLSSSHIAVPFTMGFISPLIVLPASLSENSKRNMALSHELTHIRNRDALIKLLCLAAIFLHWFNPLAYLLYWEITKTTEHVCDEIVTKDMTQTEKTNYQLMLLEMKDQETSGKFFVNSFSGNFKVLKERILVMNKTLTTRKIVLSTSFALSILLFFLALLSYFSYTPVMELAIMPDSNFDEVMAYENFCNWDSQMFIVDPSLDPFKVNEYNESFKFYSLYKIKPHIWADTAPRQKDPCFTKATHKASSTAISGKLG